MVKAVGQLWKSPKEMTQLIGLNIRQAKSLFKTLFFYFSFLNTVWNNCNNAGGICNNNLKVTLYKIKV